MIVTAGAQQAIDLIARLLLDPGQVGAIEDPCHLGIKASLETAGATVSMIPVDADGIDVYRMLENRAIRLAVLTPSHQFPLGTTMTLRRRLAVIEWARKSNAWIVEDDYDFEFSVNGRLLSSLYALEGGQRVLYVGTFSKVLFPGMRLGYVIVPAKLVEAFTAARAVVDRHGPVFEQAITAAFIESGQFTRHIRHMRAVYSEKSELMQDQFAKLLEEQVRLDPLRGGLHTIAWLRNKTVPDALISDALLSCGVDAPALSRFSPGKTVKGGLVLGFSGYSVAELSRAAGKMRKVFGERRWM